MRHSIYIYDWKYTLKVFSLSFALLSFPHLCYGQEWALKGTKDHCPFHEGLATYYDTDSDLYGVINTSGEIVIKASYKFISNFCAGTARVTMPGGKEGIIDRHGNSILQPIYKDIYPEDKCPGMYIVKSTDDKVGLFYNARLVLPVEYKSIYSWYFPFIGYIEINGLSCNSPWMS